MLLICILPWGGAVAEDKPYFLWMDETIWAKADPSYMRYNNQQAFLLETEYYVDAISNYLLKPPWYIVYQGKEAAGKVGVTFYFTPGSSHVKGGYESRYFKAPTIYLNQELFEHDLAPVAHEITHLITPIYSSLALREGLACFYQDQFGKNPSTFNWGQNPHRNSYYLQAQEKEDFEKVFAVMGTGDDLEKVYAKGKERRIFYLLSYSFTKWLIDTYGIEAFIAVLESKNLAQDYVEVYEKPLDDLKKNWLETINKFPITKEEMDKYLRGIYASRGY